MLQTGKQVDTQTDRQTDGGDLENVVICGGNKFLYIFGVWGIPTTSLDVLPRAVLCFITNPAPKAQSISTARSTGMTSS